MKGKLHKMESGYILSLNGDIDDPYAIVNEELAKDYEWYKLSLKNCQSIERGYDLDEIKRKVFDGFDGQPDSFTIAAVERTIQIMLELIGDKKFSEEDLKKSWSEGYHRKVDEINGGTLNYFDDLIQLLQQTEWDVEIIEECLDKNCDGVNKKGECITTGKPKLDSNNCLILKRI